MYVYTNMINTPKCSRVYGKKREKLSERDEDSFKEKIYTFTLLPARFVSFSLRSSIYDLKPAGKVSLESSSKEKMKSKI